MRIRRFDRALLACFLVLPAINRDHLLVADEKPVWVPISQDVTSRVKPGYPGKTAGVTVDPSSGDLYMVVPDQGQTWSNLDKGVVSLGIFDGQTLIVSKGKGLLRGDNSGKNWTPVSEFEPAGRVMRVFKGIGYWMTSRGLLVSRDLGKTWSLQGAAVDAVFGPYWGKEPEQMVVVGKQGFHETLDGGKTWHLAAPLPPEFGVAMVGPNYAWDANARIFYASSMGKDTFKFERPAK